MSFMDNSSRGKVFQIQVRDYFEKKYDVAAAAADLGLSQGHKGQPIGLGV